jgi:hypothetical protein
MSDDGLQGDAPGEAVRLGGLGGQGSEAEIEHGSTTNEAQNVSQVNAWNRSYWMFEKIFLARELDRGQITGKCISSSQMDLLMCFCSAIGFSGTIGIGLFITSGELIAISGSLGCVLAFIFAGVIITGVMKSLAKIVSLIIGLFVLMIGVHLGSKCYRKLLDCPLKPLTNIG